jgi:hypothetical protein
VSPEHLPNFMEEDTSLGLSIHDFTLGPAFLLHPNEEGALGESEADEGGKERECSAKVEDDAPVLAGLRLG